jgi:hypothetical protein
MINKLELLGYILFVIGFLFMLMLGELLGEYFVGHFLTRLPPMLQNPVFPFLCFLIIFGFFVNPHENRYIWAKFIAKLDSEYNQRSWIGSLNGGFMIGFISVWANQNHKFSIWRFMYSLCCE